MSIFCPESGNTYPDFASFESAEQGAAPKTAVISGKVAGGTVQGWTGQLTIEADTNPYDGTNSATCDGFNTEFTIRNDNVHFSKVKPIFIDSGASSLPTVRLGAFESVSNITGSICCKNDSTNSNAYAIATYLADGGSFDLDVVVVEKSAAGVWLRGASPTSKVNHMLIVDSSAGQGFRGGLLNDSGVEIKNSLVIADATAGNNDYYGSAYATSSDYLASGDTSASTFASSTSFTNQTTSELVDFANGDFRIKSASPLATGGEGGTWIGGILEESAGGGTNTSHINTGVPAFTINANASIQAPDVNSSISADIPAFDIQVSAAVSNSIVTSNINAEIPAFDISGSVTITTPVITSTISSDIPAFEINGSVSVSEPFVGNTSSISADIPSFDINASVSVSLPPNVVSDVNADLPAFTVSVDATILEPGNRSIIDAEIPSFDIVASVSTTVPIIPSDITADLPAFEISAVVSTLTGQDRESTINTDIPSFEILVGVSTIETKYTLIIDKTIKFIQTD